MSTRKTNLICEVSKYSKTCMKDSIYFFDQLRNYDCFKHFNNSVFGIHRSSLLRGISSIGWVQYSSLQCLHYSPDNKIIIYVR